MPNTGIDRGAAGTATTVAVNASGTTRAPAKKAPAKKATPARRASFAPPNVQHGDLTLGQFMAGLRHVENGGSYGWSKNRAGAQGAYQFTNYAGWAREAGVNPNDHSPAAQDRVAAFKIQQYLHAYKGNWGMVAAAWLGGPGGAHTWATGAGDPSDGNMTTSQYVNAVLSASGSANPTQYIPQTAAYSGPGTSNIPGVVKTPQPLSVKQYLNDPDIASKYGFLAAYMKDPALGPMLAKAAKEGWGENEILGALTDPKAGFPKAVAWWNKTSTTAAMWQAQQELQPGTAKERLGNMTGQVQQLAQSTLGAALDPKRAGQIANAAIAHGWSQAQLQSAIGAEFHYNASQKAYGGLAGQTLDALRQHASDYMVPLSDQTLQQWTQGVLKGTFKDTDFQEYIKNQALSLYPTLKNAFDSGVNTKTFLNPYAQLVQQTLGKNPDDLDWMDPKWSKALNTTTPDGQRAPMSLSDWGHYLRTTPDYQYTDQARQNAGDLAFNLVQHLGKVVA